MPSVLGKAMAPSIQQCQEGQVLIHSFGMILSQLHKIEAIFLPAYIPLQLLITMDVLYQEAQL